MSYLKLKADYLFDGLKMRPADQVLICHQDGTVEDIVDEIQAGDGIQTFPGLISPGFVNCHCHLELSHLKGLIPEKQGLVNFVLSLVKQRNQPEEQRQDASRSAETSMLETGTVAVGDICNGADTISVKSHKRLRYYNFIELLGWSPAQAATRYKAARELADLFNLGDEIHLSLNPHAAYSVSDELWKLMTPGFQDKTITIHNQESPAENELFIYGTGDLNRMYTALKIDPSHFNPPGISSLSYYLPKLTRAARILLVHNTYTTEEDVLIARDFSDHLFFCFCPNANLYIENRLPDIPLFLKNNTRIVLGTDSLASNHQLDILEEMKTIKKAHSFIPTSDLLVWATSNGANALSFEKSLGSFSKGKKPGVVLIDNLDGGEVTFNSGGRRIV